MEGRETRTTPYQTPFQILCHKIVISGWPIDAKALIFTIDRPHAQLFRNSLLCHWDGATSYTIFAFAMNSKKRIQQFTVFGISHHLAPVEVREAFTLSDDAITALHQSLKPFLKGGFVLSTCNRTEIYCISSTPDEVLSTWKAHSNASIDLFEQYIYTYKGTEAIDYLFQVGNGLDSQILGDFQIIGQLKSAYQKSVADGLSYSKITRLMDVLLKVSKRVKNETKLNTGVASMAYAGIQYAEEHLKGLDSKKALVYGAGKMGGAVVRKLSKIMAQDAVLLANRTPERADDLAGKYNVQNVSSKALPELIDQTDFLISAATVTEPIFTKEILKDIDLSGKVFVDLSMPRSIATELHGFNGLKLVNLDYLQDLQNETFRGRKESIPAAKAIIEEELAAFYQWIADRELSPTISALKEKLHEFKDNEIKRLEKKNPNLHKEEIELVTDKLIQKITTQFIKHAKKSNGNAVSTMQDIFELDEQ